MVFFLVLLYLSRLLQWRRSQCYDLVRKFAGDLCKPHPFRRRNPLQPESFKFDADDAGQLPGCLKYLFSLYITVQVMTVSHVSPGHQHPVGALFKRFENKIGVDPSRAKHADNAHARRVLEAADAGQICRRIRAPVTGKCNNLRLKCFRHIFIPDLVKSLVKSLNH